MLENRWHNSTLLLLAVSAMAPTPIVHAQAWSFVSSPDVFNSDVGDISGGTDAAVTATFPDSQAYVAALQGLTSQRTLNGGSNSITPTAAAAYNALFAEMQANAGGSADTFLIAGDLINGRWPQNSNSLTTNFGGGNTAGGIDNAADIYYSWYRELFRQHGFTSPIAAIGDHDIGDNSWSVNSSRANNVDHMKRAFGRNMVDPLGLPATFNGVSSLAPAGLGEYDEGSFVKQVNNVLFVTVDVFRWEGGNQQLDSLFGAVAPEITGTVGDASTHLGWLDAVLTAADNDPSLDHVIVQGHTPVLPGVRGQSSSGMRMRDRDDSPFWQVLRSHDQSSGGKVRMYFGGEVHTVTSTRDTDSEIVQLVHGNPPLGGGETNYVVFNVDGKRIEAELYQTNLIGGGGGYFQVSGNNSNSPSGFDTSQKTGSLLIDASGPQTQYETSGYLDFVDYRGLLAHYAFDDPAEASQFTNSGSLGDLYYDLNTNGDAATIADGRFGRALVLDGSGDFARTAGGLAPITEGEQRTISAWVNTTEFGTSAIFGYGQDNAANGEFNLHLVNGQLQLNIDSGISAAAGNAAINDGEWHHVAVVLPGAHANDLGDVQFFVDGVQYASRTSYPDREIRTFGGSQSKLNIGANAENLNSTQQFVGRVDDVAMWGSPLTPAMVRSLTIVGLQPELGYNASEVEVLFDLFAAGSGQASVGGLQWRNETGLSGVGGDVARAGLYEFSVVLDEAGNGVVGQALLVLSVDRDTGSVVLTNVADSAQPIGGYTISSEAGSLQPGDGNWQSFSDRGRPGWVEANPTTVRLSELNVTNGDLLAVGESINLGTAFQPSPSEFGQVVDDLHFTYIAPTGEEISGFVDYTGSDVNNLALVVDPTTGAAELRNASGFDIPLGGYTIVSDKGLLNVDGWTSLQAAGIAGWIEANPTSDRISELSVLGEVVPGGTGFTLGDLFTGEISTDGLALEYYLEGDDPSVVRTGRVLVQSLSTLPGDFNGDGVVNTADYTVWRDNLGAPTEAALMGNGDRMLGVDNGDYLLWKQNFGSMLPAVLSSHAHATVPEPATLTIISVWATQLLHRFCTTRGASGRKSPSASKSEIRSMQ